MMSRTKLSRLTCPVSPLVLPLESFCMKPITPRLTDRKGTLFLYPVPISPLTPNRILICNPAWMWVTACFKVIKGRQPSSSQLRMNWNAALPPEQANVAVLFYILFNVETCVCLPVWGYSSPTLESLHFPGENLTMKHTLPVLTPRPHAGALYVI